jgi:lysyl-tRNA synthetase class 2
MANSSLAQIREIRIEKANKLRKLGIDPYPAKSQRTHKITEIVENYDKFENQEVTLAGRLMSWREHGHLVFGNIQDQHGNIQLYIKDDVLKSTSATDQIIGFSELGMLDMGDIVQAKGVVTKTQRGEISLMPSEIKILTKAIRPLPEKWTGVKDKETLFRQRYLDMIVNPEKKWRFEKTAQITFTIREFLTGKGFLEIKTPLIQPIYGGTNAKPFKTQVNALGVNYYLAVSHELYLKRLVAAGFENVFNINGYFRNEGIDRTHNPEFSMIETMSAFHNYEYNMELTEEMYRYIGNKVFNKTTFKIRGYDVDFAKPWKKLSMVEAVKQYTGHDFDTMTKLDQAHAVLREIEFKEEFPNSIGESLVKVFEEKVEKQLIEPTFITGHPVEISPLAKQMASDPRYVERFEIYIGGIEGGDNWTELNDPVELYKRLKAQVEKGRGGDEEAHPMDIEFIEAMEHGIPPTTGLGPGIERLAMMLTETDYIDDVLFFPMMRPAQVSEVQKEIYGEEYLPKDTNFNAPRPLGGKNQKSFDKEDIGDLNLEQDFSKKIVIVVNKELQPWQIGNTIGHVSAYIGNKVTKLTTAENFVTKDEVNHPRNAQYPIVILAAKPGQMANFMQKVRETGMLYHGFIKEMIDTTNDNEITEILKNKSDAEIEYLGIGVFGSNDEVDAITKKFSLYK